MILRIVTGFVINVVSFKEMIKTLSCFPSLSQKETSSVSSPLLPWTNELCQNQMGSVTGVNVHTDFSLEFPK